MNLNFNTAAENPSGIYQWLGCPDSYGGGVSLNQAMHPRFVSPNTHSIGADKLNVAVTLTDRAEAILTDWAKAANKSRSQLMRDLLIAGAKASGNARAVALKAAMHSPAILCLLMTTWIYAQPLFKGTFEGSVEMRRGRTVRIQRSRDQFNFEEVV